MTNMRLEWKKRVTLFSKIYRHKKFGDPNPFEDAEDLYEDKQEKLLQMHLRKMDIESQKAMSAVDRLLGVNNVVDEISDLHTVNEESDDEPLTSKQETRDYVLQELLANFVIAETNKIAKATVKVSNFLLTCVMRKRFLRKKDAILVLQHKFRVELAKK